MINRKTSKILFDYCNNDMGGSSFFGQTAFDYMDPLTVISQRFVLGFIASAILLL